MWKRPGCVYMHRVPNLSFSFLYVAPVLLSYRGRGHYDSGGWSKDSKAFDHSATFETYCMFKYAYLCLVFFPPHEACQSLSYESVIFQRGLVITGSSWVKGPCDLKGYHQAFVPRTAPGWLLFLPLKATSSHRFHSSINWVLVPLCM